MIVVAEADVVERDGKSGREADDEVAHDVELDAGARLERECGRAEVARAGDAERRAGGRAADMIEPEHGAQVKGADAEVDDVTRAEEQALLEDAGRHADGATRRRKVALVGLERNEVELALGRDAEALADVEDGAGADA